MSQVSCVWRAICRSLRIGKNNIVQRCNIWTENTSTTVDFLLIFVITHYLKYSSQLLLLIRESRVSREINRDSYWEKTAHKNNQQDRCRTRIGYGTRFAHVTTKYETDTNGRHCLKSKLPWFCRIPTYSVMTDLFVLETRVRNSVPCTMWQRCKMVQK